MSNQSRTLLLVGTVMFSLSWLPGFSVDAGSGTADLSSSDATYEGDCNFNAGLANNNESTCNARMRNGETRGRVTVRKVPRQALLSDQLSGQTPTAQEELEVTVEATSTAVNCSACSRTSSNSRRYQLSDIRNVTAVALADFAKEAQAAQTQAARQAAEAKQIQECKISAETKQRLEGREQRDCLLNRLAALEPEAAARFFDQHIKSIALEMIKSDNAQTFKDGMDLLARIEQITGNNPYLKESLKDMKAFGRHHAYVRMMTRRIENMPANDPNRARYSAALAQYMGRANSYYQDRGLELSESLQTKLEGWNYSGTWANDLASFQQQLNQIYNNGNIASNQTRTGNQMGVTQPGAGRTSFGTPYVQQPGARQGPTPAGRAQPRPVGPVGRPGIGAVNGRAANGGPLINGR